MRVEIVVGRYRPDRDGVSAYVQRLVAALPEVGVTPTVTEWPGIGRWRPRADNDLVHVQFAPSAYGYSGGIGLLPLTTRRPVVTTLHEYGWWSWQPGAAQLPAPLGQLAGAGWRLGHRLGGRTGRWDPETLLLAPASRVLIVTGGGHASVVHDRLHRSATVVPIGANVDVAYQGDRVRARQELGLPEGAPLLAFFGFVHPVKGLTYLLDAVAELRAGPCPGLRLAVVGGWRSLAWPDAEADAFVAGLRDQAERLGLADAVAFLGFLPDEAASRWLTAADAAVLPFTHGVTAKSGSLLTCWAHRLPVVATEPPAGADPDVAGAVLPAAVRDVATLREATAEVLTDRSRAAGLADAGAARMGHRTWAQVSAQHRRVYEQALAS